MAIGRDGGIEACLATFGVSVGGDEEGAVMNIIGTIFGGVFSGVVASHCQEEKITMSPTCRNREPAMARFPNVLSGNLDVEKEFIFKDWEEANLLPFY